MGAEYGPKPALALDVDQTLTGGFMRSHITEYNKELDLGMTPEDVEKCAEIPGLKKTFDIPQIIAFRAQGEDAERRFQEVRMGIRTSRDVHKSFSALPHSVEKVKELVGNGYTKLRYYTVRPKEIISTTSLWLQNLGFPNSEETIRCTSHKDKVFKITRDWVIERGDSGVNIDTTKRQVVIIDDSFREIIEAAQELASRYPVINRALRGVILVGFNCSEEEMEKTMRAAPELQSILRTIALPSWEEDHFAPFQPKLESITKASS